MDSPNNAVITMCMEWLDARRLRMLPTADEMSELWERVSRNAGDWYDAVYALRSRVTTREIARALSSPLALVFVFDESFEKKALLRIVDGDRGWLALVAHSLIAAGGVRSNEVYAGEQLAIQALGDQVVLA